MNIYTSKLTKKKKAFHVVKDALVYFFLTPRRFRVNVNDKPS